MSQFNPIVHGPRYGLNGLEHVCTRLSYVAGDPCPGCDTASRETDLDTSRLDWLENSRRGVEAITVGDQSGEMTRKFWAVDGWALPSDLRLTLRDAIDAAMEATPTIAAGGKADNA